MMEPFLKWAGGKRIIADRIIELFPEKINTYYEPMVGAGAIFFELAQKSRFKKAWINDVNKDLITTYLAIQNSVELLINQLQNLQLYHSKARVPTRYYYKVRDMDTTSLSQVQAAARVIYLNRTCYNGLYRVNRSGKFNVPPGDYKNPRIVNEENLREANKLLQGVKITNLDFESAYQGAHHGDCLYFDPPYVPIKKDSFVAYTGTKFDTLSHIRLAKLALKLHKANVRAVFSNSDTPEVRKLYDGLKVIPIEVPRRINSKGTGRGNSPEVLIVTGT